MIVVATSLSGCMSSALDIQSTFQPAEGFGFSDSGAAETVPRPSADIASASPDQTTTSEAPGDDAAMALAGSEPQGMAADAAAVLPPPEDMNGEAVVGPGNAQTETTELVALADAPDTTGRIADPATARIYTATAAPTVAPPPVVTTEPKRGNGLLSLFSNNRPNTARKAVVPPQPVAQQRPAVAELWSATDNAAGLNEPQPVKPVVEMAGAGGLPGVDRERALGLNQDDGQGLGADTEPVEIEAPPPVRLASAAGLARLAPNGLHVQHDKVDVACLKPALVRVLKQVERHYGSDVVVTSGYRSPTRNKKASGAEHSLHIYCSAADIQIEGVSKWELASYLRSMPGRGGVGTYCHTDSVHIDIGPERDWNWRCRRRK